MRRLLVLAAAIAVAASVSGCESWFGDDKKEALPGKRISVLAHQQILAPDAAAALSPVQLPPPILNADWPQESGPAEPPPYHLRLGPDPSQVWQETIGEGPSSSQPRMPAPVVGGGRVYAMDARNRIRAFDVATGKEQWKADLAENEEDDDVVAGGLAFWNGRLYATTGFAKIVALDAASGKEIWRRALAAPVHGAPAVDAGRVFVSTINNVLYGLSAADGRELWPAYQAINEAAGVLGTAAPVPADESVIAAFSSGDIVAVRASSGRAIWTESLAPARRTDELASVTHIRGRPVVDGSRVFAVSYGGQLAALNLRTGERIWDREIGGLFGPWVAGKYLFVLSTNQELVCLTKDDGSIVWVAQLPAFENENKREDPILWAGPVVAGGRLIVVGSNGKALFLSPVDGRIAGRMTLGAGARQVPIVAGNRLFVVTDDGKLAAYQ